MKKTKEFFYGFRTFDFKMYIALCLLALIPAIYQTIVTKLITSTTIPDALDIIGQMEWFDLIDETICAFLILPMYSLLSKAKKTKDFSQIVFKLGLIVVSLYVLFSIGTFIYGVSLIQYMNPNDIDLVATYSYLSLETIAFMIGIIFSYTSIVFLVIDRAKYMYLFLLTKVFLSIVSDFILIPNIGINGVAISNIISNSIMGILSTYLLIHIKNIKLCRYKKEDFKYFKDWLFTGIFTGMQQFLDNIIYALMIVRMVNAVSEAGNYWVSNNFIWGWLLIPISCLSEIIRKDAGSDGYELKQTNYYAIVTITITVWFLLIPTYNWFFSSVEGISNSKEIFEIVLKNLGFYIAYSFSQIPDSIFIGIGKTKYNAINSLLCNIVYYGIWFILYQTNLITMDMNMIILMFGIGNIVHLIISIIEEKIFLKKELRN